jgi:hypothetical protein
MAVIRAVNYRDKADELRKMAVLAPTRDLRDQWASLAVQYDNLATTLEKVLAP